MFRFPLSLPRKKIQRRVNECDFKHHTYLLYHRFTIFTATGGLTYYICFRDVCCILLLELVLPRCFCIMFSVLSLSLILQFSAAQLFCPRSIQPLTPRSALFRQLFWTALNIALGYQVQGDQVIRGLPCIKRLRQLFCSNAGSQYPM